MEYLKIIPVSLFLVIFATCFVYGLYFWFQSAKHLFAMTRHYKSEVKLWSSQTGYNPFNGLWRKHLLTTEGVAHANKCNTSVIKFFAAIIIPFIAAFLLELLTGVQFIGR